MSLDGNVLVRSLEMRKKQVGLSKGKINIDTFTPVFLGAEGMF